MAAKGVGSTGESAARRIDQRIRELGDWRGETLVRVRALIHAADPAITEEWKWHNPVWSHHGIVCTGEAYTKVVKLTFPRGATIADPSRLFNSSLEGNTRRAIDIREGAKLSAPAFKTLIKAAVSRNAAASQKAAKAGRATAKPVRLLSSGNPQIAMADGDAPVQTYIAAMPGWKRDIGKRLDAIISRNLPKGTLRKAVKWNTPLYGVEGRGFVVGFYCYTRYVQLTFFSGTSLRPMPPKASKHKEVRYFDIFEGDELNEAQLAKWVKQAAVLPGFLAPKT